MGHLFRSEQMCLAQIFIQPEAGYYVMAELGETGSVQFRDLNEHVNAFQKKFVGEVRRFDEIERKLRYMEAEIIKNGVPIRECTQLPLAPHPRQIITLETQIEKCQQDIEELSGSAITLKTNYLELVELKYVLNKSRYFFQDQTQTADAETYSTLLSDTSQPESLIRGRLAYICGVINRERLPAFERMLWRISRGNVFLRQSEIETSLEDPTTGMPMKKAVFCVFFQGEQLKNRIQKVLTGFHATIYSCPSSQSDRFTMVTKINSQLQDLTIVMNQTNDHLNRVLVNAARNLSEWTIMVRKMKAIYHCLNLFNMDVTKKCLIGEGWIPTNDIEKVQGALKRGSKLSGSSIPSFLNIITTHESPPTFNRTNVFTRGFQNLIDAYGMASYREANPTLYTVITFPFLFAVMFGDAGHAIILLAFALSLIIFEKQVLPFTKNEVVNIFFSGRYIILLMGIFSFYTGLIYNDVFSKSFNLFGSKWRIVNYTKEALYRGDQMELDPTFSYIGTPYPFGMDPIWQGAKNKIIFLNSYKMKLSIIFGVTHMIFGVCVGLINHLHFKKYSAIILEFLPQILLLCFLFLYLVILMFLKWCLYFANDGTDVKHGTSCAPSVLIFFINMMLFKDTVPPEGCDTYIFESQPLLEKILVFSALFCIPVLLFGKPLYIHCKRNVGNDNLSNLDSNDMSATSMIEDDEENQPMGEIFTHQAIHTIEYVLSTVSHTASYLRLWALSLAHAQLSEVLWQMIFSKGLTRNDYLGIITIYLFFAFWAFFTVAILVLMEGLSAFLHTLRLHWVEFMSKFYMGLGYRFVPFSFKDILEQEDVQMPVETQESTSNLELGVIT